MRKRSQAPDGLSPARRRLFIVISMLIPLLFLAVIEALLRLSGFGGYAPILKRMEDTPQGRLVVSQQAGTRDFFFANLAWPGYSDEYAFFSPKDANTVRIVLVGGSAIKGFPQTRRFAASSFLREMLDDAWPNRTVEVINLGTTAVASFPVREFLEQALEYEPDLVVVYSGHNEFYGAYGVASSNQAGSTPGMLKLQYQLRGFAIVQALSRLAQYLRGSAPPSLMETMVGQDFIPADSWKRGAAAELLYDHVGSMIRMGRERDVPVLVCTLAGNERDLAPVGDDPAAGEEGGPVDVYTYRNALDADETIDELEALLQRRPDLARAHFVLGQAYHAQGAFEQAQHHFVQARDLDTMPWRATTALQQSIRRAVTEQDAALCDVERAFRGRSPGGSIGRELMDDHVHPSLQGQALLARTIVESLTKRTDALAVSEEQFNALPGWQVYAQRLGFNPYDHYAVAHTLRTLFTIPFMRASNPEAFYRFNRMALELERAMTPEIRAIARGWQKKESHASGRQPLSGMVAHALLREQRYDEAMALFEVARHSVPEYSVLHLAYTYHWLAVRYRVNKGLSEAELALAEREIARGELLLRRAPREPEPVERYLADLRRLGGGQH